MHVDPWHALYAFAFAALLTWLAVRLAGWLEDRFAGQVPPVRSRSSELGPLILGTGGLVLAVAVTSAAWLPWTAVTRGLLIGAALVAVIPALERWRELSPDLRLVLQVGAAAAPVVAGLRVTHMTLPLVGGFDLLGMAWVFPVLLVLAVVSMASLAEDLGGYGTGVCTIAALSLGAVALSLERNRAGVLALLAAGIGVGLLAHRSWRPGLSLRVAGAGLLGFLVSVAAIQGRMKTAAIPALLFPLAILALAALDNELQILGRLSGAGWLRERLAGVGTAPRASTLGICGWLAVLAGISLALRFAPYSDGHGHFLLAWTVALAGAAIVAAFAGAAVLLVVEVRQYLLREEVSPDRDRPPVRRPP